MLVVIASSGWISHSFAGGFVLGLLFAPLVYAVPWMLFEDWWTRRKRAEYGPPFKSDRLEGDR